MTSEMTAEIGVVRARASRRRQRQRAFLRFAAAWVLLNVAMNLRYPEDEPAFWYLIPSVDVVVLFAYLALFSRMNVRVPKALRVGIVLWILLVRLIRIGDGVKSRFFNENLSLWTDLRLLPELVRFAHSSLPWWLLGLLFVLIPAAVAALFWACYRAVAYCERFLAVDRNLKGVGLVVALFLCLSLVPHDPRYEQLYSGAFGVSSIPRLRTEARFLLSVSGYRTANVKRIAAAQQQLANTPSNLAKLRRRNVYLILVESYGATVFERPEFVQRMNSTFGAFESELGSLGFSLATGLLDSPTFGGRSWLAHATLATGVHTDGQLLYDLLLVSKPKPIARFFRDAGYRTVVAQPGTTRPWPKGQVFAFDKRYDSWDFDYRGPAYAWATMPDQYVLDFVRRRELEKPAGPLFIQYVLVSSHAPWSDLPVLVEDWDRVQDGAIYRRLETVHFPIEWPYFKEASEAYIRSIVYDFDVIRSYLAKFVADDSLVIILGDHQPVPDVAGPGASASVPVHVLSRDPALVAPFRARGYAPGMRAAPSAPHPPMATFLSSFLRDFSDPR